MDGETKAALAQLFLLEEKSNQYTEPKAPQLQREADTVAKKEAQASEVYRIYQKNIKASECITANILKGIKDGESPENLLIMALECIGHLTNNTLIAKQGIENLKNRRILE
ncbi:MAG: hypothetical protein R3Y63_14120 [Eubacteriales bacterium]